MTSCAASSPDSGTELMPGIPFPMPVIHPPEIPDATFDIRNYGAKEGGVIKNTDAIRAAIAAATAKGGGSIMIPDGIWLTGAVHLDNNIRLFISPKAELRFSQDRADYLPVVFSRHEDIECYKYSAFIYADGKKNIAITGGGVLNGQGKPWWDWKVSKKDVEAKLYQMGASDVPLKDRIFDGRDGLELRPAFFQPMNCSNILVENVTFRYGAFWTITPTYCNDIIVRNVHIVTEGDEGHAPNGDGVDPSSCRNVLIENCEFNTGDDCIAIKSGRDADGLRVGKPTENIVVRNCRGYSGHGGIVIGSETSGSVRNIYGTHCEFTGTDRMIRIKTARGRGGVIENLWFDNITGSEIRFEAIHVNMLYTGVELRLPEQPVTSTTPTIRNLHFDSVRCTSGSGFGLEVLGLPERAVENCTFDHISTDTKLGFNFSDVDSIRVSHSGCTTPASPVITITDGRNIVIDALTIPGDREPALRIDGSRSRNITLRKSSIQKRGTMVRTGPEVAGDALRIEE